MENKLTVIGELDSDFLVMPLMADGTDTDIKTENKHS